MKKINFKNKPNTGTPLSAENINLLQQNVEESISSTQPNIIPIRLTTIAPNNEIIIDVSNAVGVGVTIKLGNNDYHKYSYIPRSLFGKFILERTNSGASVLFRQSTNGTLYLWDNSAPGSEITGYYIFEKVGGGGS